MAAFGSWARQSGLCGVGEARAGRLEEVFFLRVEDGRFVDFWGLEDSMGRMRQLGLIPTPKR